MHGIVLYIDRVLNKCAIFSVILSDTMAFTAILQPCLADYFGMGRNMLIFKLLSLSSKSSNSTSHSGILEFEICQLCFFLCCLLPFQFLPLGALEGKQKAGESGDLLLGWPLPSLWALHPSPILFCQLLQHVYFSLHSSEWARQHFFLTGWKLSSIGLFSRKLLSERSSRQYLLSRGSGV